MYKVLPETENRSLEDIELHFSDNTRKITDRHIHKSSPIKRAYGVEAGIPAKAAPISMISDMVEMSNGTPSVVGTTTMNGRAAIVARSNNNGCDNKAFTMDR